MRTLASRLTARERAQPPGDHSCGRAVHEPDGKRPRGFITVRPQNESPMAQAEALEPPAPPPPTDRAALRRAAEAESARSFLRMASHELRTPLNAVIGFSEIIARELHGPIGDPRYTEHAALIRESGLNLLSLVNQILDIAKLESGAMDLRLRPEPVEEILAEACREAEAAAAEKTVRLVRLLDADAERVMCDRRGVSAVLDALLSNAVAFSPEGGTVTVTARRRDERVLLEVRDEGPGFDPADAGRLMRPFEQGECALVRRGAGAGLGLPFARLYAEAMGGRLHLRTAPGQGVSAVVRLPAA